MFKNSYAYNGKDSQFTHTAERIVEICKQALSEVGVADRHLTLSFSVVFL